MKTLNANKKLLPLVVATVIAGTANAKTESFAVGFTTLPDITITEVQAMSFGAVLKLPDAAECEMNISAANSLGGGAVEKSGDAGGVNGTPGQLSEDCVGGADGTPGVYEVTGINGTTVTLELIGDTDTTDIDFLPTGYVWDFNAGAYLDVDTTTTYDYQLPDGSDGSATVTPGVSRLILGGTITNQRALVADEALTTSFTVNVNY